MLHLGSGANALPTGRSAGRIYLEGPAQGNLENRRARWSTGSARACGPGCSAGPASGSRGSPGSHPAFHLRDSSGKRSNLLHDYQTLLMLLNAHHLFSIHPINFPPHISPLPGLRHRATAHLYANYFATRTKVIMLSDRKLTGLKSRMEINKLTPLNGREDGRACWRPRLRGRAAAGVGGGLPGRAAQRARLPGRPRRRSRRHHSTLLTYPVSGCLLQALQNTSIFPNPSLGGNFSAELDIFPGAAVDESGGFSPSCVFSLRHRQARLGMHAVGFSHCTHRPLNL